MQVSHFSSTLASVHCTKHRINGLSICIRWQQQSLTTQLTLQARRFKIFLHSDMIICSGKSKKTTTYLSFPYRRHSTRRSKNCLFSTMSTPTFSRGSVFRRPHSTLPFSNFEKLISKENSRRRTLSRQ